MNRRKKFLRAGLILLFLGSFVASLVLMVPPKSATAAPVSANPADYFLATNNDGHAIITSDSFDVTWINAVTIQISPKGHPGVTLTATANNEGSNGQAPLEDQRTSPNDEADFSIVGWPNGCFNHIHFKQSDFPPEKPVTTVKMDIDFYSANDGAAGGCVNSDPGGDVSFTTLQPEMSIAYFRWVDGGKIERVDGQDGWVFTQDSQFPNLFMRVKENGDGACQDRILVSDDKNTMKLYELDGDYSGDSPAEIHTSCSYRGPDGFEVPSNVELRMADVQNATLDAGAGVGQTTNPGGAGEQSVSCESNDTSGLGWIGCAIIRAIDSTLNSITTAVQQIMTINTGTSEGGLQKDGKLQLAWSNIRNIASVLLVLIALIMVISTALDVGPFDAYTIRKILPRLAAAVIFMQLSWVIMIFLINLTNDIGGGIRDFMLAPFGGTAPTDLASVVGASSSAGIGFFNAVAIGAGITGGLLLGIAGLLSLAFTTLLGVLIGFVVLVLRNIVIVAALIMAPFAIVCYILPGTQKVGKLWWDAFSKGLLMYPLIIIMFTAGRIFAWVTASNAITGGAGTFSGNILQLVIVVASFVIPYFLIPATFRLAGGAIATLGGMVNDRSKGVFDRNKKFRGQRVKQNWADTRAGNRIKNTPEGSLRSRLNRGLTYASNVNKAGLRPTRMRTRMRTGLSEDADSAAEAIMKEPPAWFGDDAKVAAARYDSREDIANELIRMDGGRFAGPQNERARTDAVEQILRDKRKHNNVAFQRARIRAQAKTGTGYQDPVTGEFNAALMLQDINDAYGNDENGAGRALAEMRGSLQQSGQIAGAAGFGTWAGAMTQYRNAVNNPNSTPAQVQAAMRAAHEAVMDNAIDSAQPGLAIYGKPSSAREFAAAHGRRVQRIVNGIQSGAVNPITNQVYSQRDLDQALASTMGIYDAMAQASPQNARAMADGLMNHQITDPTNGQTISVFDMANDPTTVNNPGFQQMRRDFGSAAQQQAAQMAAQQGQPQPGAQPGQPGQPGQPYSDRRLKKDIVLLGRLQDGTRIYRFRYLWSDVQYVGVMAQEILPTRPEAICVDGFGFYSVNYELLGFEFTTYEEWENSRTANKLLV